MPVSVGLGLSFHRCLARARSMASPEQTLTHEVFAEWKNNFQWFMQAWEGLRSQPTQLTGQSLCLFTWPGLAPRAWKSREEWGRSIPEREVAYLSHDLSASPAGWDKILLQVTGEAEKQKHGSVSLETWEWLLKFRSPACLQIKSNPSRQFLVHRWAVS